MIAPMSIQEGFGQGKLHMSKSYDTLHMGRSSIDLYANDVGVP